ncbi:MAG: 4-(cytidine 5'-diphospho)-2-C-methyl-D-erythritol kinase [Ignavibacteria bacterium]|nr:4-(cytidine 5'-diphospho)-2-C-methyl-D-erythritol kinase [Ignavibacteria bacterium]
MLKKKIKEYTFNSPAKINLGLRVLSKRKDGYHNIETIFYPVKIYDKIEFTIKENPEFKKSIIKIIAGKNKNIYGKNNICYKAVLRFLKEFDINNSIEIIIKINKNIPMGAGLAGGSSNAAAVLKILAKHFKSQIGLNNITEKLKKIALSLGSDVPVFLLNKAAYGRGRGEKLTPLPRFKINKKILIVNPGIHISTSYAFKLLNLKTQKKPLLKGIKFYNPQNTNLMINDFERVIFKKYPLIEKLKFEMFCLGAEFALMSGSGSTVYGVFKKDMIKNASAYFKRAKYKVFII